MRIGFDCAKLVKGTGKSIGIYNITKSVVTGLAKQISKEHELIVIGNEYNRSDFDVEGITFVCADVNVNSKKALLMWELIGVNRYIRKLKLDEIVFPRGFNSMFCPVQDVIIVHDLIPFFYNERFPGVLNRLENMYIMMRLKSSIRTAKKIITISEYSKQDIIKRVPKVKDKIDVILHGFDVRNTGELDETKPEHDYFIGIASNLPHKNAVGIINAYKQYYRMTDTPLDLVLAGVKSMEALKVDIEPEIMEHISCKKYLDDKEYYSLFKKAKGLVFLSLIEGFGLPPLEAMELGVPVICSDRTSLPEVVKEAGILVDPENYPMVAKAMCKVATDEKLSAELVAKGFENLKDFHWEDRIKEYAEVLCR